MEHRTNSLKRYISAADDPHIQPGALDGLTIMRYAHVYRHRTSGGVEQYLQHLDHGLLQKHRITILQMHLTREGTSEAIEVENVGIGRILWVPVAIRQSDSRLADLPNRVEYVLSRGFQLSQQQGKGWSGAILPSVQVLFRHWGDHLRHKLSVFSDHLCSLLGAQEVDLLALHWMSYDTGALISQALRERVPFVVINHFDNVRLSLPGSRKWIDQAAAIGTVSDLGIPDELRSRYFNLSDAVDTEFFAPNKARSLPAPARPIVLLPARIQRGKGHRDLLEAARILIAKKIDLTVCFAGAVDSESLHQELRTSAATMGLGDRVLFLGERSAEEIRDWYALSTMVVLPSRSEGLGRVLLEAQAMKKPIVAYDNGGMSKAFLPNESGFLVRTGDLMALVDKISFLLKNEPERVRLGECGRQFVSRQFSMPALVQRHESFYLSALSGARIRHKIGRARWGYLFPRDQVHGSPDKNGHDAAIGKPSVSILIPAFNAQEWIADTLRSAIAQTWERKEIIVVDDGSTDQTLAIARRFESDSVHIVKQKNQGASAARNKAFSLSQGDYIQWLDADDLLAPDKIARQMEVLQQCRSKRTLLSSAWGLFMHRYYRAEFVPTPLWCDLSPVEWLLRKMDQNLYMQTASWLVSRELTESAGPWDTRLLGDDDGEYFCRVLLASDGVRFVPEANVYYRGPGLAFRGLSYIGQSSRRLDAHWLSMQLHIGYLRSLEDTDRVRAACLRYLQTSLIHFYPRKLDIVKQAEKLARDLGGELQPPHLSWKYQWIKTVFGWPAAKAGQQMLLGFRWSMERSWEKLLFRLENPKHYRLFQRHDRAN